MPIPMTIANPKSFLHGLFGNGHYPEEESIVMIDYHFTLEDGEVLSFSIDLNRIYTPEIDAAPHPDWTRLTHCQCEHCPLTAKTHQHCPAAVDLEEILKLFSNRISYQNVSVRVVTPEREYLKNCDIQTGLNSLIGLVMATSACPIISQLGSLAKTHLPFSTAEETIYRVVSAYLLRQYFLAQEGNEPDFELKGLDALYQELSLLNQSFILRIREISNADANLNAIVRLYCVSIMLLSSLEDQLGVCHKP